MKIKHKRHKTDYEVVEYNIQCDVMVDGGGLSGCNFLEKLFLEYIMSRDIIPKSGYIMRHEVYSDGLGI